MADLSLSPVCWGQVYLELGFGPLDHRMNGKRCLLLVLDHVEAAASRVINGASSWTWLVELAVSIISISQWVGDLGFGMVLAAPGGTWVSPEVPGPLGVPCTPFWRFRTMVEAEIQKIFPHEEKQNVCFGRQRYQTSHSVAVYYTYYI